MVYVKLGASHGESIFMESKIYPQSQEIMTADIEVLFEFIAASVLDFCKPRFLRFGPNRSGPLNLNFTSFSKF